MTVLEVEMKQAEALIELRNYRTRISKPGSVERDIERVYRQIVRGGRVIQAVGSVIEAGADKLGRPKLALMRADFEECRFYQGRRGVFFYAGLRTRDDHSAGRIDLPGWPPRPARSSFWVPSAIVPHIPPHLRPDADLSNYHILWEANWRDIPEDPLLLRRIGESESDTWLVLAGWDLTSVERAVLRSRRGRR